MTGSTRDCDLQERTSYLHTRQERGPSLHVYRETSHVITVNARLFDGVKRQHEGSYWKFKLLRLNFNIVCIFVFTHYRVGVGGVGEGRAVGIQIPRKGARGVLGKKSRSIVVFSNLQICRRNSNERFLICLYENYTYC